MRLGDVQPAQKRSIDFASTDTKLHTRARQSKSRRSGRAIRYLARYRAQALLPYIFLIIAVLSQLAVPKLLGRIIDAITGGVITQNVVPKLGMIPEQFLPLLYKQLGYTPEELQTLYTSAEQILITATVAIVVFATVRGIFFILADLLG